MKRSAKCSECGLKGDMFEVTGYMGSKIHHLGWLCFRCAVDVSIRELEWVSCHHRKYVERKSGISIFRLPLGSGFEITIPGGEYGTL